MTLVVVTGATRGIGRAAAIELAGRGADVVLVGRERDRVDAVAREAGAAANGNEVHTHVADLALMEDVRRLAGELREQHPRIDVLANNAGALFASRKLTSEGFEQTFALNHLAPFLLTNLLLDRLDGGRVVTTASDAHTGGKPRPRRPPVRAVLRGDAGVRHLEAVQHPLHPRARQARARLHANCFHPGVVRTGFGKNDGGLWKVLTTLGGPFFRSPERGARSLVWLATSEAGGRLSGEYVEDEKVAQASEAARDPQLAHQLWERSAALVGAYSDPPGRPWPS